MASRDLPDPSAYAESARVRGYMRYLVERGCIERWGPTWATDNVERPLRIGMELDVIERQGFSSYFVILWRIMNWMRQENIVYGFGRGSVGGSAAAYAMGIHEVDPLEFGLLFERFMNPDRVAHPDVDIDVSQRHRPRVLEFIKQEFEDERTAVLQVAAFAKAGARSVVDMVAIAHHDDPDAYGIGQQLKSYLPEGAHVTGGTKQAHDLAFWLENNDNSATTAFRELATKTGWMDTLLKLDGIQTHLQQHAAGVVIISREDLARLPQTSADGVTMMTAYDMYSLDDMKYLKIDILGLRTLDIVSDAHKFCGGDGSTPSLVKLWQQTRDNDPAGYQLLCDGDTTGVFQVETSGYRRTLKGFQPRWFEHVVQLNALYRPGALDSKRESDGKNMVEVYIERMHGREPVVYTDELKAVLHPLLGSTQGIFLFQEQAMQVARAMAGFTAAEADNLRKAIGKKQLDRMAAIEAVFKAGCEQNGYSSAAIDLVWDQIKAAARYSWNRSHSVFYGAITQLCAYFKANEAPAFYAALINSLDEVKDRQAEAIAEARQKVTIRPPDINVAEEHYTLDADRNIVFGLNGIKGMGEANRGPIILERFLCGLYADFKQFDERLPSVPINMKLSLIRCGAFDELDDRSMLLAVHTKPNGKTWTIAEFIKHNRGLKKKRELPQPWEVTFPTQQELARGELAAIGFYVSNDPMADVVKALSRLETNKHWGGEIDSVKTKKDRRGAEMADFTILTNALTKQKCMVFGSDWPQVKDMCVKGNRVIVRGRMDGNKVIAEALFPAGDYRHFRVIKLVKDGKSEISEFDRRIETIEMAENSGYSVMLV